VYSFHLFHDMSRGLIYSLSRDRSDSVKLGSESCSIWGQGVVWRIGRKNDSPRREETRQWLGTNYRTRGLWVLLIAIEDNGCPQRYREM
jgi:hypothetical protein